MDDQRTGSLIRALRVRRGWRQVDLAQAAGLSQATVSRVERGHVSEMTIDQLRRIAASLELRLGWAPRWRGGDLDRLLADRHARMHDVAAPMLAVRGWRTWPEVSFSVFGERGAIDLLAWHPARRTILVVELKTEIVNVNELVSTLDRKRRLAMGIARDRELEPTSVGSLLFVAESPTNRRRVARYDGILGAALPIRGAAMRRWLRGPHGTADGLLFLSYNRPGHRIHDLAARSRVRCGGHARFVRGRGSGVNRSGGGPSETMDSMPGASD